MRKAFTLTEILIVVTIIAILSAITAGFLGSAKARAKATVCASNQKQLATGILLYIQDYNDVMPIGSPFVTWSQQIESYLKTKPTQLACPTYPRGVYIVGGSRAIGHAMNSCLVGIPSVQNHSATVMLADVADIKDIPFNSEFSPVPFLDRPDIYRYSEEFCVAQGWSCYVNGLFGAVRHSDKGNYTFLDGHTKLIPPERFRLVVRGHPAPCPTEDRFLTGVQGDPSFSPGP